MQDEKSTVNRKKIGFLVTKGVWGGAQKYVFTLATSLPKDGYDVFVVLGSGNILKEKLEAEGVRTYAIESMKRDFSFIAEFGILLRIFRIVSMEKPDVLHLNSPKAAGLGSFAGRILGVPAIIQTIHGFTWNEDRGVVSKTLIVFFTWLTMIFCHANIVLSRREERQAKSLPFIDRKIMLIPLGVGQAHFKERNDARRELFTRIGGEPTSNALVIGTIAELHNNKGYRYALEALSKIKAEFLYFIIGAGEEEKNIRNWIEEYSLNDKVFLLGHIDKAHEYLKAFDIFLLSSIKEGLPYTILEAGQASLPIIASALGGIPEAIENGKSGILITPKKSGEITRAIEYLIENPDKRKEYAENLHNKVTTDHSIQSMLEKTIKLYN